MLILSFEFEVVFVKCVSVSVCKRDVASVVYALSTWMSVVVV